MKVRYERGALADLDEIFAYIAKDKPGQRPNSSPISVADFGDSAGLHPVSETR